MAVTPSMMESLVLNIWTWVGGEGKAVVGICDSQMGPWGQLLLENDYGEHPAESRGLRSCPAACPLASEIGCGGEQSP